MTRSISLALLYCGIAAAADPALTAWIRAHSTHALAPEVHSVEASADRMIVTSAGISLKYFGPLQLPPVPAESAHEFVYRIPLHPQPRTDRRERVPEGVIGTFVNGLPIYNHFAAISWNGANLWHYDAVAWNDDGSLTATGHPRAELTHPAPAGLLEQLTQAEGRHSPLIGFALDGYPVYGPWAFDGAGVRRMRSSYRLRPIAHRRAWPDGTRLTPAQFGPDVDASTPAGTFVEDYEYVAGSGDLDESNGRFAVTPEYPGGTYAYFLTTDDAGRLAFPYLIGPRFHGATETSAAEFHTIGKQRLELSSASRDITAGTPVRFRLLARDAAGEPIRNFEWVHERPIHLLIASGDLAEFHHIHPELAAGDGYEVTHTFAHGGRYRLWADYSLPGEPPRVDSFDIDVSGPALAPQPLTPSPLRNTVGPLTVELSSSQPLRAGVDIPLTLSLTGAVDSLEPYLGAWAHIVVVSDDLQSFAHAHPLESVESSQAHTHLVSGAPPREIHIVTSFPSAGLYKLWAQFQRSGEIVTVPFVLRVLPSEVKQPTPAPVPADAIRIRVTQRGYEPPMIEIPAHAAVTLAFTRDGSPNCGSQVVFPSLGIRQALPLSQTVLIQLPAQAAGQLAFSCGMGMFRGMVVAR